MSWFYEALSDLEFEFDCEQSKLDFEHHIEEAFNDWTVYKVFGHKNGDHSFECYENVWEFLHDIAIQYVEKHPQVKLPGFDEE